MNIERILKQFEDHYKKGWAVRSSPEETKELIEKYLSIPLTLPITDESMKRVCEVLTRAGYKTFACCEGHHETTPKVYLGCTSQYHLKHLTDILCNESIEKHFPWDLRASIFPGEVFGNPNHPLAHLMCPDLGFTNASPQNNQEYQKMIDDLDIIGICVLRYFSSVNLKDLERYRKKMDFKVRTFEIPDVPVDFFRN
jgi:hypothetical protein